MIDIPDRFCFCFCFLAGMRFCFCCRRLVERKGWVWVWFGVYSGYLESGKVRRKGNMIVGLRVYIVLYIFI